MKEYFYLRKNVSVFSYLDVCVFGEYRILCNIENCSNISGTYNKRFQLVFNSAVKTGN